MTGEANPFLKYRHRLDSFRRATAGGITEDNYVDLVEALDERIVDVIGHGFTVTPTIDGTALAKAAGLRWIDTPNAALWIKTEPDNVGGSHKARHLMGVALDMIIGEALGAMQAERLAIASCGNAALGAAVIARAIDRPLDVFVPVWADEAVIADLDALGASINRCERRDGEAGDPCYFRFKEAVAAGARAFCVQGTDAPTTFDGGRTLGWELADQVGDLDRIYVQVGGGALATATAMALPNTIMHPVQSEGCAPLRRAWDKLSPEFDFDDAATHAHDFMWPWEDEPTSLATGILDDVAYDWLPLLRATHASGGEPIVATETAIVQSYNLAHEVTHVPVCATGTSGLAGLICHPPLDGERVAVLFTGIDRT